MKRAASPSQGATVETGEVRVPSAVRPPTDSPSTMLRALESAQGELVLGRQAENVPSVTAVRSTLLSSSLQAVRTQNLVERYTASLPREYHHDILHTLAPTWLPIDTAMAHYWAMDALGLPEHEVLAIGSSVGERLQGSVLGTLARGAKHAGLTPWSLAAKIELLWSRVFLGGAVTVWKLGPKDARLAVRGLPLMRIPYFRVGWRGVVRVGVESITSRCYVHECRRPRHADGIDFVVSWS